jgi:ABC-type sugar transport system permease subunit
MVVNMKTERMQMTLYHRKNLVGWWYVLPFVIGFLLIYLPAIVQSAVYSFEEVTLTANRMQEVYIGFANYSEAFFSDVSYRVIILNTFRGILLDTVIIILFSFFIANVLNQKFIGRTFARTVFFLPVILAMGLIAQVENKDLIMSLFGSNTGTEITSGISSSTSSTFDIASLLANVLDAKYIKIITDAVYNISQIVNDSGVQILIFLAGLQAISPSIFEAAKVEGATKWEEFWKITFPIMGPIILVNVIYTVVDSFMRPSYGVLEFIHNVGIDGFRFGYAAALSWVFFVMVTIVLCIVTFIATKFMKYSS